MEEEIIARCVEVKFNPINPKPVTAMQRKCITEWINNGIISGKVEGIDYMTCEEAGKLISEVMADLRT